MKINVNTFYKVRKIGTDLYYNPNKPGNRVDPTFDKTGKEYKEKRGLIAAKKAVEFCLDKTNNHWGYPLIEKTPIKTEIVEYKTITKEIGIIK